MDGKGRYLDNIFIERLWRTIKYEEVYLKKYESGIEAKNGLELYMPFYNKERLHQSLNYKTPYEVLEFPKFFSCHKIFFMKTNSKNV